MNTNTTEQPGVRPPTQLRAHRSMARILDAAAGLLHEQDRHALTLGAVLERSGVSNGAFYSRFRDIEAMVTALFGRFFENTERRVEASLEFTNWKGRSPREPVAACVRTLMDLYREDGGTIRALRDRARHRSADRESALALVETTAKYLVRALSEATWRKAGPALEADARFALRAVYAYLDQLLLYSPDNERGRERFDRETETRLIALVLQTLGMGQLL